MDKETVIPAFLYTKACSKAGAGQCRNA